MEHDDDSTSDKVNSTKALREGLFDYGKLEKNSLNQRVVGSIPTSPTNLSKDIPASKPPQGCARLDIGSIPKSRLSQDASAMENGGRPARIQPRRTLGPQTFFHTDKQGSVVAMSDVSGALVEGPYIYDPYGNCFTGGTPCAPGASESPYRYTRRRFDPEPGCYYCRARYYCSDDTHGGGSCRP